MGWLPACYLLVRHVPENERDSWNICMKNKSMTFRCSNNICIIFFCFLSFSHACAHAAAFYLPGSSRRWRYSVNFNTRILGILRGCELLSNSNRCSALFTFLPAGHCHRRSPSEPLPTHTGCHCPLFRYSFSQPCMGSAPDRTPSLHVGAVSAYSAVYDEIL